ncbi:tRNA pseudouridine(38-40) synthase TruA [Marinifilum caeruleilacunae]|uniref:tRNA pseudouridine synthase A n=1 Tax=Marinifilum caeruleilacunae TaxID=2499076 RepID=A0ABX1WXL6_9BACT|nr:tRNA pseudouridine(38-40) synthase TruA [Marinifilum caeruleilacunae]NOU60605.1 tRNA pseudouridine(38-40) synthase TruA [Marinifilum caeruleilacunae]
MSKHRYFFHIAYKGSEYRGWQKQVNAKSVQETIEEVLSKFLKEKVHCIGCGRTDAGVHASQYYFHIDVSREISQNLLFAFNRMLPPDISIFDFRKVEAKNHAQHSANLRTYNYFIHISKNPYLGDISSLYSLDLNCEKMQDAANLLVGEQDFRAFCKTPDRHNHTICKMEKVQLYQTIDRQFFRIEFKANRFLKGMIRIIVHQLLEVGQGKLSVEEFKNQLNRMITPKPLVFAYPQGLYLSEIKYPFISNECVSNQCLLLDLKEWIAVSTSSHISPTSDTTLPG